MEGAALARAAKPGQFVQIHAGSCLLKRPFSICDAQSGKITILYKVVGKGTTAMTALKKGDTVDGIGPLGRPFCEPSKGSRSIYVAGSVGVAPLCFLAKTRRGSGRHGGDVVFIGGRTKHDCLCRTEFNKLGVKVVLATEDGSAGHRGLVSSPFEKFLCALSGQEKNNSIVYACGPKAMMKAVAGICAHAGVSCVVSLEEIMSCGLGVCMGCVVKVKDDGDFVYQRSCTEGPVMEAEKIIWE